MLRQRRLKFFVQAHGVVIGFCDDRLGHPCGVGPGFDFYRYGSADGIVAKGLVERVFRLGADDGRIANNDHRLGTGCDVDVSSRERIVFVRRAFGSPCHARASGHPYADQA